MSFQEQFKKHLSKVTQDTLFDVYNLCSPLTKSSPLINNSSCDTYLRHRLILVSIPTVGFVCGLESYEYTLMSNDTVEKKIVYISKVDTMKQGITGQVVQAYLASLPASSVFVFARAQPQYLFANSAKTKTKKVLGDRELVSWWLHQLNKTSAKSGWWIVPGIEDEMSALLEIGARRRGWKAELPWHYGTSYSPQAKAMDVIPQFEDDAKSRFLKDHAQDALSCSEFWNLLAFSEECGKTTGFFEIELKPDGSIKEEEPVKEEEESESFTEFWNKLMSLDFSDKESVLASTQTAVKEIERIFHKESFHFQIKIDAKEQKIEPKEQTKQVEDSKRPAVNTLSVGLIKRKKV